MPTRSQQLSRPIPRQFRPERLRHSPARPFILTITARAGKSALPFLRRHLRAAHGILRPPLRELSLALVGDRHMAQLHQRFLGISGPTDVLTFPIEADTRGRTVAGEVVVCVPEARRRAREYGTAVEQELLLYALHGLLHLCGYDDKTPASYQTMHRAEDQILTQLGVGPVFAPEISFPEKSFPEVASPAVPTLMGPSPVAPSPVTRSPVARSIESGRPRRAPSVRAKAASGGDH